MAIKPVGKRVLIRLAPPKTQTKSGILLPETTDKPQLGLVLDAGDDVSGSFVDKIVFFPKYSGTEVGFDLIVLDESEILAVYESDGGDSKE